MHKHSPQLDASLSICIVHGHVLAFLCVEACSFTLALHILQVKKVSVAARCHAKSMAWTNRVMPKLVP